MGKNHKKLLNNLEELRKSAGLTQQELSVAAEVSRKSINAIENGIYIPSTVLALKIAKTIEAQSIIFNPKKNVNKISLSNNDGLVENIIIRIR